MLKIAMAAALAALGLGAKPAPTPVDYRLTPEVQDGRLVDLAVEIRFAGDADGETRLALPDHWAAEHDLWRFLRDVTVEGATQVKEDGPAFRVIHHAPNAPLVVRYKVVGASDADLTGGAGGNRFAPLVRDAWTFDYGEGVFAEPANRDDAPARFTWGPIPAGWRFASDLDHIADGSRPGKVSDVIESIVIGAPDLKIVEATAAGGRLRVATFGQWTFTAGDFAAMAARVIAAETRFWGDKGEPFLIAMRPMPAIPNSLSLGGTGRGDAFSVNASADAKLDRFRYLIAHEHLHTWNPSRLGGGYDGEQEPAGYWFSEGFTDFYTWRLLLRSGEFSLEDFVAAWNTMLGEYANSPVIAEPNARIVKDTWNDYAVQKLSYQRGAQLAAVWDARLRQRTHGRRGLDDVMLAMRRGAGHGDPKVRGPERFLAAYAKAGGGDLSSDVAAMVTRGERIMLPDDAFGDCIAVNTATYPTYDRGYDVKATTAAGNVVTGLREDTPAYAAGLRNGMKLLKRESGVNDSRSENVFRVQDGDTERVIRFKPAGKGMVTRQSLALKPDLTPDQRKACAKTAAG